MIIIKLDWGLIVLIVPLNNIVKICKYIIYRLCLKYWTKGLHKDAIEYWWNDFNESLNVCYNDKYI